jgi:hypothetical protein
MLGIVALLQLPQFVEDATQLSTNLLPFFFNIQSRLLMLQSSCFNFLHIDEYFPFILTLAVYFWN